MGNEKKTGSEQSNEQFAHIENEALSQVTGGMMAADTNADSSINQPGPTKPLRAIPASARQKC